MKLLIFLIAPVLVAAAPAYGTMQRPDIVIHDGVVYRLHERPNGKFPLETLWTNHRTRPRLSEGPGKMMSSACWRGYVAIWEVEEGILYLRGLDAWQGDKKANLKTLFPQQFKNGKVQAAWFTGTLILSAGFGFAEKPSITLTIEKGKLAPDKAINIDKE